MEEEKITDLIVQTFISNHNKQTISFLPKTKYGMTLTIES